MLLTANIALKPLPLATKRWVFCLKLDNIY